MNTAEPRPKAAEPFMDGWNRILFEAIDDAVFVHDVEGRILEANPAACRRLGYTRDEMLRLTTRDIDEPDFAAGFQDRLQSQLTRRHLVCVGRHVAKNGQVIPVEINTSAIELAGRPAVLAVIRDITERKRSEEQIQRINAFLDSIVENIPNILFVKDADSLRFERVNKAAEDILGYRRADLIGKSDYDFFPREQADFFTAKDREVLQGEAIVDIAEEEIQTRAGRRFFHTRKLPIRDESGKARYLLGISEDITERKALEETRRQYAEARERHARELEAKNRELIESERRYRQLTESSIDPIVLADQDQRVTLFNPAAERAFGYPAAEVLGQRLEMLMPEEYRAKHRQGFARFLATREPRVVGRTVELCGQRKDGSEFPLELSLSALDLGGELQFLGALRDLTERNRLRALMVQTEKLASIGMLSAGVAHEINNPLAYVANNLVVLERDVKGILAILCAYEKDYASSAGTPPEAQAIAAEIDLAYIRANIDRLLTRTRDGVQRVTKIIQSLSSLARTAPPQLQEASIPDLVDASLEIIGGQLRRRGIEVEQHYGAVPKVRCVTNQLSQVLLNLLINALQAIEAREGGEGRITITADRVGDSLMIEIADNGCGIASEDLPRVFDPFFTTKPVGEGTGLGLSISHNIVTGHGGRIEVESRPGAGTRFRIFLPLRPPAGKETGQ
jgi:PAS domain S-box-containing protein